MLRGAETISVGPDAPWVFLFCQVESHFFSKLFLFLFTSRLPSGTALVWRLIPVVFSLVSRRVIGCIVGI